ncbi:MAG TPA: hypothetical protein VGA21_01340 [Cyclobacteriaceae bacterium]|jgi:hypothetical protein
MRAVRDKVDISKAQNLLKDGLFFKRKIPDKVELLYLGFHLFKVTVDPGNSAVKSEHVLIDVLTGAFSFLNSENILPFSDETQNYHSIKIDKDDAKEIAKREYAFHLLHRNLRTKLKAEVRSVEFEETILYPFWVGYFIHFHHYSLEVIDAINGQKQSGAIKKALIQYLADEFNSKTESMRKQPDIALSLNR